MLPCVDEVRTKLRPGYFFKMAAVPDGNVVKIIEVLRWYAGVSVPIRASDSSQSVTGVERNGFEENDDVQISRHIDVVSRV